MAAVPIAGRGGTRAAMRSLAAQSEARASVASLALVLLCSSRSPAVRLVPSAMPAEEVALTRNADGIVVLTGGASRVADAIELLANGHGKRLLISGVNPGTTTRPKSRARPRITKARRVLRRSRSFGASIRRQRRRDPALGERARLPFAHRGDVGLSHAARDRRVGHQMPDVTLDAVPRRHRKAARTSRGGRTAPRRGWSFRNM